jgi:hypothetical protein
MGKQAMDGLFSTIFHGERSELREKYRLSPEIKISHPRMLSSSTARLGCAKIALAQRFSFIFFKNE